MRRVISLIHTSEITILLNLPSIILVLIFINVKALAMLMLFLEQSTGDLHGPCRQPGAHEHHVGDPCNRVIITWMKLFCTGANKIKLKHTLV